MPVLLWSCIEKLRLMIVLCECNINHGSVEWCIAAKAKYFYYSSGIWICIVCLSKALLCRSQREQPGVRASLESLARWSVSMAWWSHCNFERRLRPMTKAKNVQEMERVSESLTSSNSWGDNCESITPTIHWYNFAGGRSQASQILETGLGREPGLQWVSQVAVQSTENHHREERETRG